jgi:hypothetical protein
MKIIHQNLFHSWKLSKYHPWFVIRKHGVTKKERPRKATGSLYPSRSRSNGSSSRSIITHHNHIADPHSEPLSIASAELWPISITSEMHNSLMNSSITIYVLMKHQKDKTPHFIHSQFSVHKTSDSTSSLLLLVIRNLEIPTWLEHRRSGRKTPWTAKLPSTKNPQKTLDPSITLR